jgi:O-antigen ligase
MKKEKKVLKKFKGIIQVYWLFVGWCIITQLLAFDTVPFNSLILMLLRTAKWILYSLVFLILITEFISGRNSIHYIFNGVVFGLALQGLLLMFGIGAQSQEVMKYEEEQYEHVKGYYRKEAFGSQNPNVTGSLIACFLVFLIPGLIGNKKSNKQKSFSKSISYIFPFIVIISLLFLLYSGLSRGAMLTFAFGMLLIYANSRQRLALSVVIIVIGIYAYNSNSLRARIETRDKIMGQKDDRTGGRLEIPLKALSTAIDLRSYLIGSGFYGRFYNPEMWIDGTHNNYIQILWETGVIGLLLFLSIFYQLWKYMRKIPEVSLRIHILIMLLTLMFTILPGEFLYYGPYLCAQIILITYAILNYDKRLIGIKTSSSVYPNLNGAIQEQNGTNFKYI